jgi:hypothetical protein
LLTFTTTVLADLRHRALLDHVAFNAATTTRHGWSVGAVLREMALFVTDAAGDVAGVTRVGAVHLLVAVKFILSDCVM